MIAHRIQNMIPSATFAMVSRAAELRQQGVDVIGLNAGEPDFQTPEEICIACKRAIDDGKTLYTPVAGILPLREAICTKLKLENGLQYNPSQICVSTGAKQALSNAIMSICNPGDEIIVPTPCWVSYIEIIKLAGGVPILVSTNQDFTLDVFRIEKAITKKTKGIIINTPNNPTGAVYDQDVLLQLAEIAVRYDLYVISDEVYEKLVFSGKKHVSIAALGPEIFKRTILINGFSKAFAMTGWRLGYVATESEELIKGITALQGHTTSNTNSFVQWAGITALERCAKDTEQMRIAFEERRDFLYQALLEIPGITCNKPEGAFYLMPDVRYYFGKTYKQKVINTSEEFCNFILDEASVALVQGDAFFMPGTVRIAYTNSMNNIKKGVTAIKKALEMLR